MIIGQCLLVFLLGIKVAPLWCYIQPSHTSSSLSSSVMYFSNPLADRPATKSHDPLHNACPSADPASLQARKRLISDAIPRMVLTIDFFICVKIDYNFSCAFAPSSTLSARMSTTLYHLVPALPSSMRHGIILFLMMQS